MWFKIIPASVCNFIFINNSDDVDKFNLFDKIVPPLYNSAVALSYVAPEFLLQKTRHYVSSIT
jgi:hypothetical protein